VIGPHGSNWQVASFTNDVKGDEGMRRTFFASQCRHVSRMPTPNACKIWPELSTVPLLLKPFTGFWDGFSYLIDVKRLTAIANSQVLAKKAETYFL